MPLSPPVISATLSSSRAMGTSSIGVSTTPDRDVPAGSQPTLTMPAQRVKRATPALVTRPYGRLVRRPVVM